VCANGALASGLVAVGYPAAREIVRRYFDCHAIPFEDADAKAAELPRDRGEDSGSVVQGYAKRRARKNLCHGPFEFYQVFFGDTVLWV